MVRARIRRKEILELGHRPIGITIRDPDEPEWHVIIGGRKAAGGRFEVDLQKGLPAGPAAVSVTGRETLERIDRGETNATPAVGRARSADPAPVDVSVTPALQPTEGFLAGFLPLILRVRTRGFPEMVSFAPAAGREAHGATMVVLYFQKGLRPASGQIRKDQRVNAGLENQVNPFPAMMIGLLGRAMSKVGGVEKILEAGQMAFAAAGTAHEAWKPFDEPAEFIILMFGEGACGFLEKIYAEANRSRTVLESMISEGDVL